MSLSEQTPRVDATLLTATDAIAFAYPFADADELLVVSDERGVLTRVTHYTVAGEGEAAGGTVTMVGGTVGEKITIVRNTPISQTLTLRINGKYFVTDVTAALDKLTKILQEVDEELARCLQTSVSDGTALELPDTADRLGKLLRFDSTGTLLLAVTELGDWKGDWVTATDYVNYDIFRDASTASVYYVLTAHTSTSIAADLASGKISEVIDGSAITDAQAAAEAAQAAAEAAQALAEAALDAFTDQYLGAFASAPTLDNDGDPLTVGDVYFNTVDDLAYVWDGSSWILFFSETTTDNITDAGTFGKQLLQQETEAEAHTIFPSSEITFFANAAETVTSKRIVGALESADVPASQVFAQIGSSVTSIGSSAFAYNSLTSVTIPNSVTSIGVSAFSYNALTSVTIPNSVTTMGSSAFAYNNLTSVTIPNSVTTIGNSTFAFNNLTSVTIPNSVTTMGGSAFAVNPSLNDVTANVTKTVFDTGSNILNNTAASLTLRVPAGDTTWDALEAANPSAYQGNAAVTVVRI